MAIISSPDERCCTRCKQTKPTAQFSRDKNTPSGYKHWCKVCRGAYEPRYRERRREYAFQRKYGLSTEQYNRLLKAQDGLCAICGQLPTRGWLHTGDGEHGLVVDHDHATGAVRGLLCTTCNLVLGQFNEDPTRFERAIRYLKEFSP